LNYDAQDSSPLDSIDGAAIDATTETGCTPFSTPVLVAGVSTSDSEFSPALTADELQLFFHGSSRAGTLGSDDIYRATRPSLDQPFDSGSVVLELSTSGAEGAPDLTPDGLTVYFSSGRSGGVGSNDIWVAKRPDLDSPFAGLTNVSGVNSSDSETGPAISSDELELYFSSRRPGGPGTVNVWVATRASRAESFGTPVLFAVANIGESQGSSTISEDGLTLIFGSTPPGGRNELYMTTRPDRSSSFSAASLVTELNSDSADYAPDLVANGTRIYFTSNRDGGAGNDDIYVASRSCSP
jgi:Tol biopolymer transport system component